MRATGVGAGDKGCDEGNRAFGKGKIVCVVRVAGGVVRVAGVCGEGVRGIVRMYSVLNTEQVIKCPHKHVCKTLTFRFFSWHISSGSDTSSF